MRRSDMLGFLASLSIIGLMIWGLVYFINHGWARLPTAVALIVCMLLAVMAIGYPIYALARWSDRYLTRVRKARKASGTSEVDHE